MKLGDNMATMDTLNTWGGDVGGPARKCRPPRIGEIPKHSAVDRELPSPATERIAALTRDESKSPEPEGFARLDREETVIERKCLVKSDGVHQEANQQEEEEKEEEGEGEEGLRDLSIGRMPASSSNNSGVDPRATASPRSGNEEWPLKATAPVHLQHSWSLSESIQRMSLQETTLRKSPVNFPDDQLRHPASGMKVLPKAIKVYQLLSTQSEDQGDTGEPDGRFTDRDRRISLQISCPQAPTPPCAILRCEEQEDSADRDEDLLRQPREKTSSSDARLAGNDSSRRDLNVSRPIYPYCPYSPYASPQGSPRNRRRPMRESRRVSIDSRQGALQLNQYKLLDNIGQGSYGIVKLVYNEEDGTHYALKILSKRKLMKKAGIFGRMAPSRKASASCPLAKVYREIALLKKLDHPNVVKLVEVLDDPDEDNLYLVFELVERGEVLQVPTDKPLDEQTARKNFRDVIMGIEYLHYQRIVHRDIKPSNLLVDSEGRVKIADLGVSAELRASGELLSGPAGTPAFAAPETTTPGARYSGTCDVWSLGVTLYCLVTGRIPWDGSGSIVGVQAAVRSEPLKYPEKPELSEDLRDFISKMLAKNPAERITLGEIKEHPWLTDHGAELLPTESENCRLPVTVTDEEVERVVTRVPKLDTLILIKTMLKQHSFQNPFVPRRAGKNNSETDPPSPGTGNDLCTEQRAPFGRLRTLQFQRAGRSNSAPDSYDWHTNVRQRSVESSLPPVTEVSNQEIDLGRR
ncbi:calcium/calmodulin-dependent protein kinase kinase 1 isoform X2 [Prorops nasuta]|uniref:calcium/calmodulin-dependent protein kinase kinase 1 isoform X2 n=1 Tax=Prorops nasuta TaxID=863751 RepID=UPI0034CE6B7B